MTRDEFGIAYERNFHRTVGSLIARGLRFEEAEELAQIAWTKGWQRLDQLRDARCVGAWVSRIAVHAASDLIAKRMRARETPLQEEALVGYEMNLTDQLDVRRAIRKCAHRYQVIVEQLYFEGYSERELAQRSGQSVTSIRGQAYRARRVVREHFAVS